MNSLVLGIIGLRSAALALAVAGDKTNSDRLHAFADLVQAGKATDDHMALVAEKLKAGEITDADWDDVMARINEDSAKLQSS